MPSLAQAVERAAALPRARLLTDRQEGEGCAHDAQQAAAQLILPVPEAYAATLWACDGTRGGGRAEGAQWTGRADGV